MNAWEGALVSGMEQRIYKARSIWREEQLDSNERKYAVSQQWVQVRALSH